MLLTDEAYKRQEENLRWLIKVSGEAVVSQDKTSDIIDASYYCANCKGQGKIIIRPLDACPAGRPDCRRGRRAGVGWIF